MDLDEVLLDADDRMGKAVDVFKDGLKGIRAGTANPGLVESVRVDYYGSQTPLQQLANIGVPDPQLIVIKPYDPSSVEDIVKAIQKSDIGINPQSDGKVVRLQIPGLSEERRQQLAQRVKEMAEEARIAIRNIRRDGNKEIQKLEKASKISEDACDGAKEEIQEFTDDYIEEVDELMEKKTEDIMKV
ncbi:MAG: ribosome recycling factor [Candidatus Brocadiia bacterium]